MESYTLSAKSISQKIPPRHLATQVDGMVLVPAVSIMSVGSKGAQNENQYFSKLQMFEVFSSFRGQSSINLFHIHSPRKFPIALPNIVS